MISRFFGLNMDFAGAITAIVCAVHCSILPIFLSFGMVSATGHNHIFDWVLLLIGVVIAGFSLYGDYISKHRNTAPIMTAGLGFLLLFIGIESHGDLFFLNIIGGLMIASSHLINWRITHTCAKCVDN